MAARAALSQGYCIGRYCFCPQDVFEDAYGSLISGNRSLPGETRKGISLDPHIESDTESGQLHLLNISWHSTFFPFLIPVYGFRPQTLCLWH